MDVISAYTNNVNVINPELVRFHEGSTSDSKDMGEIGTAMEVLTKVDLELAYSSEKLLNLESLLIYVLSWENDFEAMAADDISVECIEKSLTIDLLFNILESEVKEVDISMDSIRVDLVDAHQRLSSCRTFGELFSIVEGKLHDSEDSLKKSRDHVLEMKMQLAKLQMTSLAFNHTDYFSEYFQVSEIEEVKPRLQSVEKVHVLRMLEKSLSRELDLEKKLTESKLNEEDLKLKLRLTEQVAFIMEEAAEVVWGRFLEAENASVVLMGVSKDLVTRHQMIQFNLNGFNQREDEFRLKLENCIKLLNVKDGSIEKLNSRITQLVADNLEVSTLRGKVKSLEEKVKESESKLKKANASNEEIQERLREMEKMLESLKENIFTAESRAETAEEKVAHLTESNTELSEELNFLKGSHERSTKKVSVLEKQSRELEHQLQHAKASSEVGQEQQNMLYSAIWDMETLIDELKQKVSRAEVKIENAEDQCLLLTDTNLELTKEVDFLRVKVESLEKSMNHADAEKMACAKDISIKTNLIMDLVMQLASERERITKQLYSQKEEKRIMMETLRTVNKDLRGGVEDKNLRFSSQDDITDALTQNMLEKSNISPSESVKIEEIEVSNETPAFDPRLESSIPDSEMNLDEGRVVEEAQPKSQRMLFLRAILVLSVSVVAAFLVNWKPGVFDVNIG